MVGINRGAWSPTDIHQSQCISSPCLKEGVIQHAKEENIKLLAFQVQQPMSSPGGIEARNTHFSFWSATLKFSFSLGPQWLKCTSEELLDTRVLHTPSLRLEGGNNINHTTLFAQNNKR